MNYCFNTATASFRPPFALEIWHIDSNEEADVYKQYSVDYTPTHLPQFTIAVFRVYPKGQNPQSLLRNKNNVLHT